MASSEPQQFGRDLSLDFLFCLPSETNTLQNCKCLCPKRGLTAATLSFPSAGASYGGAIDSNDLHFYLGGGR